MQAAGSGVHTSKYSNEDKIYWKNEISKLKISGLSRREYCRQNKINYDKITYAIKRLGVWNSERFLKESPRLEQSSSLLRIQLKAEHNSSEPVAPYSSLTFKNGCILQVHNEQALSLLLEKMV